MESAGFGFFRRFFQNEVLEAEAAWSNPEACDQVVELSQQVDAPWRRDAMPQVGETTNIILGKYWILPLFHRDPYFMVPYNSHITR